jgi:hypothetical protein
MTFAARQHTDAALAADVQGDIYRNSDVGGSTTQISFKSNGDVEVSDENGITIPYRWKTGGGSASDYEIRWTNTSGTLSAGQAGIWETLGITQSYYVLFSGTGLKSCTGTVEIRMAAAPNTVLDSASITLTAAGTAE